MFGKKAKDHIQGMHALLQNISLNNNEYQKALEYVSGLTEKP